MAGAVHVVYNLLQMGALQQGEFRLKSGEVTGLYISLCKLSSEPSIYDDINSLLDISCPDIFKDIDLLCGSTVTAIPFVTALSIKRRLPMIIHVGASAMARGDYTDAYGPGAHIEGHYRKGQRVLIITDVLVTGLTTKDTIKALTSAGLVSERCLALVAKDRETTARIECPTYGLLYMEFIQYVIQTHKECRLELYRNKGANILYNTVLWGQSNHILSCDKTTCAEIKEALQQAVRTVCRRPLALKIRSNIIRDMTEEFMQWLQALKDIYLIDDLAISDPAIATSQLFLTTPWADAVTVHRAHEPGTIEALAESGLGLFVQRALTPEESRHYAGVVTAVYDNVPSPYFLNVTNNDTARISGSYADRMGTNTPVNSLVLLPI